LVRQTFFALKLFYRKFPQAFGYFYCPLLLVGLFYRRKCPRRKIEAFMGILALFHVGVIMLLAMSVGYLSRRHCLPAALLLMPFAAAGLIEAADLFSRATARLFERRLPEVVVIAFLLYFSCIDNVMNFHVVPEYGKGAYRKVGLWMKENTKAPSLSLSTEVPRITYYSGELRVCRPLYGRSYDEALWHVGNEGADYVIVQRDKIKRSCPDFFDRLDEKRLIRLYSAYLTEGDPETEIIVYRVHRHGPE
jgi:hypothetical protein